MDRDLASQQDARQLLRRATEAQKVLARCDQSQTDRIVEAMARAATDHARELAELAVEETGMGRVESKIQKNLFVSEHLHAAYRNEVTCGVIRRDAERGVVEIAYPVGVVAGIIPTTNPTSTAIFKILISLKGRNAIVLSPHPRAERCIRRSADVMRRAAQASGAPADAILVMHAPTLEGTQELMRNELTSMIVATGGPGVVQAAYSSGKPAYGVGPGNAPVFVHRSADLAHAARCLVLSQTFDYGTLCCSEQSIVVERTVAHGLRRALEEENAHFCLPEEAEALRRRVVNPGGSLNTDIVGQSAPRLARLAGFQVPSDTTILIAPEEGVGPEHPLSRETLAPILAWYETENWETGCERCLELVRYGGEGHTLGVYARDREVIEAFGLEKPVARVIVNGPTSQGAVGYSTGIEPSMTLGCGTMGGNVTSDNIGPRHLVNRKRVAYPRPEFFRKAGVPLDPRDGYPAAEERRPAAAPRPGARALLGTEPVAPAPDRARPGHRQPPSRDFYRRDRIGS